MQQAVYYPGFEVQDTNWLKFALLYIDVLHPIIPPRATNKRGELFQYLRGETDLIQPYPPDYNAGAAATLDAIDQVERVLRQPKNFAAVFRTSDITIRWKDSTNWDYELFREKYSVEWASFCVRNGLGKMTNNGLVVETSLGLMFMSILADIISEVIELPSLTDNSRMSDISILTRRSEPLAPWSVFIASHIIDLQLPIGLDQIPLEIIVAHRNKPDFKKKLHAFHNELRKYIQTVEDGTAEGDFFQTRGSLIRDFSDDLANLGAGLVQLTLGFASVVQDGNADPKEELFLAQGAVLATRSIISIRNTWRQSGDRRFTRKYLADLQQLSSPR